MTLIHAFELLPVALASIAAVTCAARVPHCRRFVDRAAMTLAVLCCVLLIAAQTSWWASSVLQMQAMGHPFADVLWTVFNTAVAAVFLLLSWPRPEGEQ